MSQHKNTNRDEEELFMLRQQWCDMMNIMAFGDLEDDAIAPFLSGLQGTMLALIDKLHSMGSDTFLLGVDEEGYYVPTEAMIKEKKIKDPDKEFFAIHFSKETKSGSKEMHVIRVDKTVSKASVPMTEARRKELERKKRYYLRHKEKLLDYQQKYDQEHRIQIHFKNKNYYLTEKQGKSRTYNYAPYLSSPKENGISYQEITEHEKEPQENE